MGIKISWRTFATIATIIGCITGYLTLKDTVRAKANKYIHNQIEYYNENVKVKWTSKNIRIGLYYQKNQEGEWELWYRHVDKKRYQPIYDPVNENLYIIVGNISMWCE